MKTIKELLQIAVLSVILIGVLYSQSNFLAQVIKPPVIMKHFAIVIDHWNEPVLDSLGVAIPDSFKITQGIRYVAELYDEDGKLVQTGLTQGDLLPYMTGAEISGIQAFLDGMATKAKGLIP